MEENGLACLGRTAFWGLFLIFGVYICGGFVASMLNQEVQEDYDSEIRDTIASAEEHTKQTPSTLLFDVTSDNLRFRIPQIYDFGDRMRLFFVITNIDALGNNIGYNPKVDKGNIYLVIEDEQIYPIEMGGAFVHGARIGNVYSDSTIKYPHEAEGWIEFAMPDEPFKFCYESVNPPAQTICRDGDPSKNPIMGNERRELIVPTLADITRSDATPTIIVNRAQYCNTGKVVARGLNLRRTPALDDNVVTVLRAGTDFSVTDCAGTVGDGIRWFAVTTTVEGVTFEGWVSSGDEYIRFDN